jgi:DNA repair protein RecN (Recombination protein N)
MIRYLSIRNLAVIESVAVEFDSAFNVLTGETGAGKSILVEAVGLLLGGRAAQDLIRTGADVATVEAVFDTPEGREVIVRRELTAQGRSRAFIDGTLATASGLKDLAASLVELHGQHEHQQLLDPAQHLLVLDELAGLGALRDELFRSFGQIQALRQRLDRLRMDDREREARRDLIEFQLGELVRAQLMPGEDDTLAAERQVLRNADRIQRLCQDSYLDLYDGEHAALDTLERVWKRVTELATFDTRFAPALAARDDIKAQLTDMALTIRDYADSVEGSPERLQEVEERLVLLERLKRKYGPTLADVIARRDTLADEQALLASAGDSDSQVHERLRLESERFLSQARALSEQRHDAAGRWSTALESQLADLAMPHARFEIRLQTAPAESHWHERGIDSAEFFLSANVGEDPRPLARIASGGELSRVMLALKTLTAESASRAGTARTLIFDEVDAGIGGRVATVVGEKLAALGRHHQVLCITHLPQVAASGRTHFLIQKQTDGGRTVTSVDRLSRQARIDELARMMGGADAGTQARAGAEELLAAAEAKGEQTPKAKGESPRGRKTP